MTLLVISGNIVADRWWSSFNNWQNDDNNLIHIYVIRIWCILSLSPNPVYLYLNINIATIIIPCLYQHTQAFRSPTHMQPTLNKTHKQKPDKCFTANSSPADSTHWNCTTSYTKIGKHKTVPITVTISQTASHTLSSSALCITDGKWARKFYMI